MLSVTYKSGANQLHFEGEDRYINNPLLHRAYFNLERPTAPFSYHELAALVSGADLYSEAVRRPQQDVLPVRLVAPATKNTTSRSSPTCRRLTC